jgi:hypothetical protein
MGSRSSVVLLAALIVAASAGATRSRADGLPVLGVDAGATGIAAPGQDRYVTIPAGPNTILARVIQDGGKIRNSRLLHGTFTIPAVAYDGSAGGISGDGRTLVLITPRTSFPRVETTLRVIDTRRLKTRGLIKLQGDFSFDAISPRGASLYLIQYTSALDPTRYLVRRYDLLGNRLVAAPVVDPHEPGEKMRGQPLTRATSRDGRWAYTLYDGAGKTPFIHALDTRRGNARCIDLVALAGADLSNLRMRIEEPRNSVEVMRADEPLLTVDRGDFAVSIPAAGRSAFPWLAVLVTLGALAAVGLVLSLSTSRRRRERRTSVAVP